jgi:calcium-translocating P-type ATPase
VSARPDPNRPWHAATREEVLGELGSRETGLSGDEARARLREHGPNRLPESRGPSALELLVDQVRSPLMYALVASAAVAAAFGELDDAAVVLAVVVLNTLIGFLQEFRAGRAIAALAELVAEPATVRRDGEWTRIPAEEVVPGDVLTVAPGDRVSADARLLGAEQLRTQESVLTGESAPVDKDPRASPPDAAVGDRHSMIHAGTVVSAGTGIGVAVATGPSTQVGQISALLGTIDPLQTPLTRELDRVGRVITAAIGVAAVALGIVAAVRGFPLADAALAGISLAVAAVPEGLPAVVTIALAVGVRRMARRRAIIRNLPAVETLGSTTVVASDKTGTLTRNQMTVQESWLAPGAAPEELLLAEVLCNDAEPGGVGDPTETALLAHAAAEGLDPGEARRRHPRLGAIPFDSGRKLMATRNRTLSGEATYVKGAPEAVLSLCAGEVGGAAREVERLADAGHRVLVLATGEGGPLDSGLRDLRLLGLAAMIDPPRETALDAVTASREAGVRVMMITGDHPRTALAIGRTLGLPATGAVTGPELEAAGDAELEERVRDADVYARVAPEHKLRLVRALQAQGEIVAMTGDGVNDAPALRQADIGVAMGRGGSAAAKEAADMVLADDDFGTLRAAIEEGRRVYDNLVKALSFVLPTSLGQALIIAVAVLAFPTQGGQPLLPVEPVQILWINLIVAVALALPLAFEAPEPDLMRRPPRDSRAPLLDTPMIVRTLVVSVVLTAVALTLFALERARQLDALVAPDVALARAQTTAVTGAVLLQALYLLTCRSLTRPNREIGRWSNPFVYVGIAIVVALQALFVFAPFMHDLFGSAPIDARAIAVSLLAALVILPVTGVEERWRVRRLRSSPPHVREVARRADDPAARSVKSTDRGAQR